MNLSPRRLGFETEWKNTSEATLMISRFPPSPKPAWPRRCGRGGWTRTAPRSWLRCSLQTFRQLVATTSSNDFDKESHAPSGVGSAGKAEPDEACEGVD